MLAASLTSTIYALYMCINFCWRLSCVCLFFMELEYQSYIYKKSTHQLTKSFMPRWCMILLISTYMKMFIIRYAYMQGRHAQELISTMYVFASLHVFFLVFFLSESKRYEHWTSCSMFPTFYSCLIIFVSSLV